MNDTEFRYGKKLKICIISSLGKPPFVGGIENVVDTLINSTLRESSTFSVFDTYRKPDPSRSLGEKILYATSLVFQCRSFLKLNKPDIVHIHFCSHNDFWKHSICLMVSKFLGLKVVFHLHGGAFDKFFSELPLHKKLLGRRAFNTADYVVVLSNYWKIYISETVKSTARVEIVPNPIDCDRLSALGRHPDRERPTILLLGSIGHRKGHFDLINALPKVVDKHSNIKLLFAGAEEERGATKQLIELATTLGIIRNVDFLGPINFEEKVKLLSSTSILALPSYAENMPISILEGMAAKVPVLSSTVGAIPEVLEDGRYGILVSPGDVAAITEGILALLGDHTAASEMGCRAGAKAKQLWDVDVIVTNLSGLYASLGSPQSS